MPNEPQAKARPQISLTFQLGGLANKDYGFLFSTFEFQGMVNGGYIIRAKLFDAHYNLLNALIEEGYFKETRKKPVSIKFQIKAGPDGAYPKTATKPQVAILLSMEVVSHQSDMAHIEFIAIDPPSWYLNMGDASGSVWKGRVDQVIQQIVSKYAPPVKLEVGRTIDSSSNKWWMMRQDPKTFLASLMDWSASITQQKTQWLVEVDGYNMKIKEQATIPSRQRAFYRYYADQRQDTIQKLSLRADNALSVVQTKLITAGLSSVSGQYLDKITDSGEKKVFIKDANTPAKQIAKTNDDQSFTKPPDGGPTQVGWTEVTAIPEIGSAGELGLGYDEYIDGRPRGMWLNMVNALLRVKFTVLGHGEWSECYGLGVDTIFVKWIPAKRSADGPGAGNDTFWWVTGNWLVYGFHHKVDRGSWLTDVYCARFDNDSAARKVGGIN